MSFEKYIIQLFPDFFSLLVLYSESVIRSGPIFAMVLFQFHGFFQYTYRIIHFLVNVLSGALVRQSLDAVFAARAA